MKRPKTNAVRYLNRFVVYVHGRTVLTNRVKMIFLNENTATISIDSLLSKYAGSRISIDSSMGNDNIATMSIGSLIGKYAWSRISTDYFNG